MYSQYGGEHESRYNTEVFFGSGGLYGPYANIEANPYVVGSAAFNAANGLPPGPSLAERELVRLVPAAEQPQVTSATTNAGALPGELQTQSVTPAPDASSSLPWVAIAVLAVIWLATK